MSPASSFLEIGCSAHSIHNRGSRSTKAARGTCSPAPVSDKRLRNASSHSPKVVSCGLRPSRWLSCSNGTTPDVRCFVKCEHVFREESVERVCSFTNSLVTWLLAVRLSATATNETRRGHLTLHQVLHRHGEAPVLLSVKISPCNVMLLFPQLLGMAAQSWPSDRGVISDQGDFFGAAFRATGWWPGAVVTRALDRMDTGFVRPVSSRQQLMAARFGQAPRLPHPTGSPNHAHCKRRCRRWCCFQTRACQVKVLQTCCVLRFKFAKQFRNASMSPPTCILCMLCMLRKPSMLRMLCMLRLLRLPCMLRMLRTLCRL